MSEVTTDGSDQGAMHHAIAVSGRNPVAARLLTVLLIVGGLFAASRLEMTVHPEIDHREIRVTVHSPGASPDEVEREINRRLEERLLQMDGIRSVTAEAREGMALVTAGIGWFVSRHEMLENVRAAVARLEGFPPAFAERPRIELTDNADSVANAAITLAVRSSSLSADALRLAAQRVREDLLALEPVTLVSPHRVLDREITIEVDEETLREHDLTIGGVAEAAARSTGTVALGELRTESGSVVLRANRMRSRGTDFGDIVLKSNSDGTLVTVDDVARVTDGHEDIELRSELDGIPAVFLVILVDADGNWFEIATAVRAWLADYEPPRGVEVVLSDDVLAEYSINNILGLLANVALGFILVLTLLSLVFDLRLALWIAIGVPASFLGACLLFPAFDVVITTYAIFALFIVIGIVVDDAVVVGESIADQNEQGMTGVEAATEGARRVLGPVSIGVFTTMLAFAPMLFTYGTIGQIFRVMPIVVILVLAVSLVEAFLILPAHLAHGSRWSAPPLVGVQRWVNGRLNELRDGFVVPVVAASLRRPFATISIAIAGVLFAAVIVVTDTLRFTFMEITELGVVELQVRFPEGTPFEITSAAADEAVAAAHRANEQLGGNAIKTVATFVGAGDNHVGTTLQLGATEGTHLAEVKVYLKRMGEHAVSSAEFKRLWQGALPPLPGVAALRFVAGGRFATAEYAFTHPDADVVAGAVGELRAELVAIPGVSDVFDSHVPGKRQFEIEPTPLGIAAGLTRGDLAVQVRERFFGLEVQRFQRGADELKVVVRYPRERRRDLSELGNEHMVLPNGAHVPFAEVARIVETRGYNALLRVDGDRAGVVGGYVDVAQATTGEVHRALEPTMDRLLAQEPELKIVTLGTQRETQNIFESLSYTVPLAIAAMYILIAILLRSYLLPVITLVSIPLAATGSVLGHLVLGYDLTMASLFGILAVGGVVINDTLVLLDRYNTIRAQSDVPPVAAIASAARQRFRAIILTTATTVAGLAPMLYVTGMSVDVFAPVVVSIIFGLIVASVGVLFLLPAVLLLQENAKERLQQWSH